MLGAQKKATYRESLPMSCSALLEALLALVEVGRYCIVGIGSATGTDEAGQHIDIKGNVTKGNTKARFIGGDNGIIGPGIDSHLPTCQVTILPVVGKAGTSRIEIPG